MDAHGAEPPRWEAPGPRQRSGQATVDALGHVLTVRLARRRQHRLGEDIPCPAQRSRPNFASSLRARDRGSLIQSTSLARPRATGRKPIPRPSRTASATSPASTGCCSARLKWPTSTASPTRPPSRSRRQRLRRGSPVRRSCSRGSCGGSSCANGTTWSSRPRSRCTGSCSRSTPTALETRSSSHTSGVAPTTTQR